MSSVVVDDSCSMAVAKCVHNCGVESKPSAGMNVSVAV